MSTQRRSRSLIGFRRWNNIEAVLAVAALLATLAGTQSVHALTVDFEDLTVFTATGETGSYFNGNRNGTTNSAGWDSGGVHFGNSYSSDFGGFWNGWSYSTVSDVENGTFSNQYASVTGSGAGGSRTYAVGFSGDALFFDVPDAQTPISADVTNTIYAESTIENGNEFSKKFGGVSGDDPDFFTVEFTGMSGFGGTGSEIGVVEFVLADYRLDSANDYRVETWQEVDLRSLAGAKSIKLGFDSTDVGEFGINTPLYVALDNLRFSEASLYGDLNNDGLLNAADIDFLSSSIRTSEASASLDLTSDGAVDEQDRQHWVQSIMNTYFGDSNLDGEFNTGDLTTVFQAAQYEDGITGNSTWATGDWNCDGEFGTADLIAAFQAGAYIAASAPRPMSNSAVAGALHDRDDLLRSSSAVQQIDGVFRQTTTYLP
ncbi:MAG: DUF4465 domain-containing protein [Planctomycetales bacterium]|nr:DUF4465 domain-containing protein [Planctomycetales bacterium]